MLLHSLERVAVTCGRLDAYRGTEPSPRINEPGSHGKHHYQNLWKVERRLGVLRDRIGREIDRTTAAFLLAEHARRVRERAA